jgi:hypothetical protein
MFAFKYLWLKIIIGFVYGVVQNFRPALRIRYKRHNSCWKKYNREFYKNIITIQKHLPE